MRAWPLQLRPILRLVRDMIGSLMLDEHVDEDLGAVLAAAQVHCVKNVGFPTPCLAPCGTLQKLAPSRVSR